MTEKQKALKPCPFCGEPPEKAKTDEVLLNKGYSMMYTVACRNPDCALSSWKITENEAAKAWNTRTDSVAETLDRAIERIEDSILDLSYYQQIAMKAKANNKWIDSEIYKINISIDRLETTKTQLKKLRGEG